MWYFYSLTLIAVVCSLNLYSASTNNNNKVTTNLQSIFLLDVIPLLKYR